MAVNPLDDTPGRPESNSHVDSIPAATTNNSLSEKEILKLLESQPLRLEELYTTLIMLETSCRREVLRNDEVMRNVWGWTLNGIHPKQILANASLSAEDSVTWSRIGDIALRTLLNLAGTNFPDAANVSASQIVTLIFWHISDKQWILPECKEMAKFLLNRIISEKEKTISQTKPAIQTVLLEESIRPAFQRSRPKNITAAGRKAMHTQSQALTASDDDKLLKPWKFGQSYVADILEWVIYHSDLQIIEASWHLITPPVLTLLDDEDMSNKVRACQLLQQLLKIVPSKLWARTGLGKVFEDALMPALAYLPPVTDESDAEKLLEVLYPTLIALCKSQVPSPQQSTKRTRFLDEILRSGILTGLSFAGENVKIASLLLDKVPIILSEMGIQSVRHLKTLIPLLVSYLSDPFAFASPALLQSAIKVVQSVIMNGWPRMDQYCGEIFRGLTVCYHRLGGEEHSSPLLTVKDELKTTMKLFVKALGNSSKVQEMRAIISEEDSLRDLLVY